MDFVVIEESSSVFQLFGTTFISLHFLARPKGTKELFFQYNILILTLASSLIIFFHLFVHLFFFALKFLSHFLHNKLLLSVSRFCRFYLCGTLHLQCGKTT